MKIFDGITIIDLSRVFSGPFATRHFSDFGARVIKVEPPIGDDARHYPPIVNGVSGYYEQLNRGKYSVTLNLKKNDDLNTLYKLCETADIFVENYSPKVKVKLKINYQTIKSVNPNIIYASLNAVKDTVDRKYYDVIAQAESGLISLNGDRNDMKISTAITDAFAGMKLAHALSSALYYRAVHGKGLKINVSMLGSAYDLLEQNLIESSITGENPPKVGNMDNAIAPFGVFRTKNGSVAVACGNEDLWHKLADFVEIQDRYMQSEFVDNSHRIKNINLLVRLIESKFAQYTTNEIKNSLDKLGIPCGKVMKMMDILQDQDNYSNSLLIKKKHSQLGEVVESVGGIFYE